MSRATAFTEMAKGVVGLLSRRPKVFMNDFMKSPVFSRRLTEISEKVGRAITPGELRAAANPSRARFSPRTGLTIPLDQGSDVYKLLREAGGRQAGRLRFSFDEIAEAAPAFAKRIRMDVRTGVPLRKLVGRPGSQTGTSVRLDPGFFERQSRRLGRYAVRRPLEAGALGLIGADIFGPSVVQAGRGFVGLPDPERLESAKAQKELLQRAEALSMQSIRLQSQGAINAAMLAAVDPQLYNTVMAGRRLPQDAFVIGGAPRVDLMDQLVNAMSQGQFSQQTTDPLAALLG